jgi:hypothetical protein
MKHRRELFPRPFYSHTKPAITPISHSMEAGKAWKSEKPKRITPPCQLLPSSGANIIPIALKRG